MIIDKNYYSNLFNHVDKRFLIMIKSIFKSDHPWEFMDHTTSYRAINELIRFYNNQFFDSLNISLKAIKKEEYSFYLLCNSYFDVSLEELQCYFLFLDSSEILILTPSIKSRRSFVKNLVNKIASQYSIISYHIPIFDEKKLSPKLLESKLIFCMYHQSKEIERKIVLIFCFDRSYYKFYNRAGDKIAIINAQYVDITWSNQYLTLIHDASSFLQRDTLFDHYHVI